MWGFRSMGRTRTLDSHASRLRRKIAGVTDTPYVLNEWGVGRPVEAAGGSWREVDTQAVPLFSQHNHPDWSGDVWALNGHNGGASKVAGDDADTPDLSARKVAPFGNGRCRS